MSSVLCPDNLSLHTLKDPDSVCDQGKIPAPPAAHLGPRGLTGRQTAQYFTFPELRPRSEEPDAPCSAPGITDTSHALRISQPLSPQPRVPGQGAALSMH